MNNSFSLKSIRITLEMASGINRTIEGLACDVQVRKPGLPDKNKATVKIWGLRYDSMKALTMLAFKPLERSRNHIMIEAGTRSDILSLVFQGDIVTAYANFNSAPDPYMLFEAQTGSYPQRKPAPALTINGDVQAAYLFAQWANESGYLYCNEGVTSSVINAWFPGSPVDKMMKLARDIGCELIIDDDKVVTMPRGRVRSGSKVFLSKDTGMIGYPDFTQDGISCSCLYNPVLQYGGLVEVESIVPGADGEWRITDLSHSLSTFMPSGGKWESQISASYVE